MDLYDFNCNPLYNKQFDAIGDNGADFGFSRRCMKLAPTRDEDIYIRGHPSSRRDSKKMEENYLGNIDKSTYYSYLRSPASTKYKEVSKVFMNTSHLTYT